MDLALREAERRWRSSGEPDDARRALAAAARSGDGTAAGEVLTALAGAWTERGDELAASIALGFAAEAPQPDRLRHAHAVDALACAGHVEAAARYEAWFPALAGIVGRTAGVRDVRRRVAALAPADVAVLLHGGESGSGYLHTAQALHALSGRTGLVVVYISTAALDVVRLHLEALPEGGTLYAAYADPDDGPGWLTLARAACAERRARLVVSAHRTLDGWPADLLQHTIRMPPLRERLDDLPLLARALLRRQGLGQVTLPPWLEARMRRHTWPGNVRELEHVIHAAHVTGRPLHGGVLDQQAWRHLPE